MNFFTAQDQARRATRRLVILYVIATALIVAGVALTVGFGIYLAGINTAGQSLFGFFGNNTALLAGIALLTVLVILGATIYKTSHLSSGGGRVAQDLGGTMVPPDTTDPLQQRLRNVVEEMSIASGVPVPEIYVLERESGINAFAAGYTPGDAAIAVTRGTLELLDRDELQGVVAHEFSHILNGDMRINIRLMGILFGIMVLGLMGRIILRGSRHSSSSSRRGNGIAITLAVGLGLTLLGWIGVFFARLIKSGVSRQREYLADASAVQFTRQTTGLAGALKKIGGFKEGSYIRSADPEEVSHMLFGSGAKLAGLFATHPPLGERIRALDPNFKDGDYPEVTLKNRFRGSDDRADPRAAGIASSVATVSPASIVESAGQPTEEHVAFAHDLHSSIPEALFDAAHSSELAYLLTIALVLDPTQQASAQQLNFITEQLGEQRRSLVEQYHAQLADLSLEYRLPLLEMAFPALRRRPPPQLEFLIDLTARLIDLDGELALYEYCFYRILATNLQRIIDPTSRSRRRASKKVVRDAAVSLLQIVARYGQEDGEAAFSAGLDAFGKWRDDYTFDPQGTTSARSLDESLDTLLALNGDGRRMLLEAVTRVVSHDDRLTIEEAGLVRVICASLEIPLPPQIGVS